MAMAKQRGVVAGQSRSTSVKAVGPRVPAGKITGTDRKLSINYMQAAGSGKKKKKRR